MARRFLQLCPQFPRPRLPPGGSLLRFGGVGLAVFSGSVDVMATVVVGAAAILLEVAVCFAASIFFRAEAAVALAAAAPVAAATTAVAREGPPKGIERAPVS